MHRGRQHTYISLDSLRVEAILCADVAGRYELHGAYIRQDMPQLVRLLLHATHRRVGCVPTCGNIIMGHVLQVLSSHRWTVKV